MPYPTRPDKHASYRAAEQALGNGSFPGTSLDTDFANQRKSINETISFLKGSLRSDGQLRDESVTLAAMSPEVKKAFGVGPEAPAVISLRGFLSVEDLGVVPAQSIETATDQSVGINLAIAQARAEKRELLFPEGIYGLGGAIGSTAMAAKLAMTGLGGGGAKFYAMPGFFDTNATALLALRPGSLDVANVPVTADIVPNRNTITVATTAGMLVGMEICVRTATNWYYDARDQWFKGEQHEIAKIVSPTVVEIAGITRDFYDVSEETVYVSCWKPSEVHLDNLRFEFPIIPTIENDLPRGGVSVYGARDFTFSRIHTFGGAGPAIEARRCADGVVEGWSAKRLGFETQGYGFVPFGGRNITCRNFRTWGLRRAFDASWFYAPARDMTVTEFDIEGGGYEGDNVSAFWPGPEDSFGVGSHGPSENLRIETGTIKNVRSPITARGRATNVHGVDFVGRMEYCVQLFFGEGLTVENCTYTRGDFPGTISPTDMPKGFLKLGASLGDNLSRPIYNLPIVLKDNTVTGTTRGFVDLYNAGNVRNLTVKDNEVLASPDAAQPWYWLFATGGTNDVSASVIYSNDVSRMEAINILESFEPGIALSGSTALGRRVRTGPRNFLLRLGDDDNARAFWLAEVSLRGGVPVWVTVNGPTAARSGHFQILPAGTIGAGAAGSDIALTNTALTGTTGTDGKLTFSLGSTDIRVENRLGSEITIDISV